MKISINVQTDCIGLNGIERFAGAILDVQDATGESTLLVTGYDGTTKTYKLTNVSLTAEAEEFTPAYIDPMDLVKF